MPKRGRGGFNRFHAFSFGVAKAGMEGFNEEKVGEVLRETITNKQFYITQEVKMKEVEMKIVKFK